MVGEFEGRGDLSPGLREKILSLNAMRLYNLAP